MNNERYLLVVSGPSGIGKDTVVSHLIANHPDIELSVSATTRPPRGYEADGEHYHFLSLEDFLAKVENGEFVEFARYAGNYYGTLKNEVDKRISRHITCVLVIEVNGADNVKRMYPGCTTVFIAAPSIVEHERRLRKRGSESEAGMAERLLIAEVEMQRAPDYDFQLINDDAEACAEDLYAILKQRQAQPQPATL